MKDESMQSQARGEGEERSSRRSRGYLEYDLVSDVQAQKANITFGQLLALNPKLRHEWSTSVSTRLPRVRGDVRAVENMALRVGSQADVLPLVEVIIEKKMQVHAYIDGGAQVCVMIEAAMKESRVKVVACSNVRMRMVNHAKASCLGIAQDVRVKVMRIECLIDFFVMKVGENAYPIILGRPCLLAIGAKQEWGKGMFIFPDKEHGRHVVLDLKTKESHFHPMAARGGDDLTTTYKYDSGTASDEGYTETEEDDNDDDLLIIDTYLFRVSIGAIEDEQGEPFCVQSENVEEVIGVQEEVSIHDANEDDWGFEDVEVTMDEETQVLTDKAMERIQEKRKFFMCEEQVKDDEDCQSEVFEPGKPSVEDNDVVEAIEAIMDMEVSRA
ncbi:hypothetical protein GOP47_0013060 [Adiantum capillus-veneris]|uniref:Aspartic peptidase DDI1-type domain-containing protein n=1 Tax=Adiantum capillus-veneris TaxID=13818 RepID=A0A9D4ZEZ3_ADICA|nr:hypothetical protein GOP47_0013060 [Adiantum capillus-veneris]